MNPIIWRKGVCDPHVKVFQDRVYLYATHDNPGYDGFNMTDWQIWSSKDLVNWQLDTTLYPKNFHCGEIDQCWATDAAYKNGKYYWYFSTGDWGVGVGVGDTPYGPFKDALGEALVDYKTPPLNVPKWDPCVFVDEDGNAYLIVGSCANEKPYNYYLIARLNDDMISLAEPLRKIVYHNNPCPEDKASIHRYKDKYYLTHSSFYAVSDHVYGPYEYVGNTGCNIDHGSFFTYHNQTYFASGGMDNPSRYLRASYLAPCHYLENGEIHIEQKPMEYGVGQYDANWEEIEAKWYYEASNPCKMQTLDGKIVLGNLKDGDYLYYQNVNNIEADTSIDFYVASECDSAFIEIHENSADGALLGVCKVENTGSFHTYRRISCNLKVTAGVKQIYLVFKGEPEKELVRLDWFAFNTDTNRYTIEPHLAIIGRGAMVVKDEHASCGTVVRNMHLRGAMISALVDGKAGGEAIMKIKYATPDEEASLSLYINDKYVKKVSFPKTGSLMMGEVPVEVSEKVELKSGVNAVKLVSDTSYQSSSLNIDNVVIEMEKNHYKTYAAANGILEPKGNGCWEHLPQRENDPKAFGARVVKYFNHPKDSITLEHIDGGDGGEVILMIHYCKKTENLAGYDLFINEEQVEHLYFMGTGTDSMDSAKELSIKITLKPHRTNTIKLVKDEKEEDGILVDAFSVVPCR